MAENNNDPISIEDFQAMVKRRPNWRALFSQRVINNQGESLSSPLSEAFTALTQNEALWQLAVSVAAYIYLENLRRPTAKMATLVGVTTMLETDHWETALPGFQATAAKVSQGSFPSLLQVAPRLSRLFETYTDLTANTFYKTDYCREKYPNDPEGFLRCVRGQGGNR